MILTEKHKKDQHYRQVKLIIMNILQVKKILPFDQSIITEQANFTYSPLGKVFEKKNKNN